MPEQQRQMNISRLMELMGQIEAETRCCFGDDHKVLEVDIFEAIDGDKPLAFYIERLAKILDSLRGDSNE